MKIAITGANGFIGRYCAMDMLDAGYDVHLVTRSRASAEACKQALSQSYDAAKISVAVADLTEDNGWSDAFRGCDAVLHVASPLPAESVSSLDDLLGPARDGSIRVLEAARQVGVRRVVVTSSLGAVCGSALKSNGETYTQEDWTDPTDGTVSDYNRSKTLAERAVKEFSDNQVTPEVIRICPGVAIGPLLTNTLNTSNLLVARLWAGAISASLPVSYEWVDVRDVARLHRLALEHGQAGDRWLCAAEFASFQDIVDMMPSRTEQKRGGLYDASFTDDLNVLRPINRDHTKQALNWEPRALSETIGETVQTLRSRGMM